MLLRNLFKRKNNKISKSAINLKEQNNDKNNIRPIKIISKSKSEPLSISGSNLTIQISPRNIKNDTYEMINNMLYEIQNNIIDDGNTYYNLKLTDDSKDEKIFKMEYYNRNIARYIVIEFLSILHMMTNITYIINPFSDYCIIKISIISDI